MKVDKTFFEKDGSLVELLKNGTRKKIIESSYSKAKDGKNVGNSDKEKSIKEGVDGDVENGKREKPGTNTTKAKKLHPLTPQEKERLLKKLLEKPRIKKIVQEEVSKLRRRDK